MGFISVLFALLAQEKPSVPIDQKKVDAAVEKGAAWLLRQEYSGWDYGEGRTCRYDDFVLYTLLHAGVDRKNPLFQKLLQNILGCKLEVTYCVAFQAMLLSELDPTAFQPRILQCAQFLIDTQCANGQWNYGRAAPRDAPTPARCDVPTGAQTKPKKPSKVYHLRRNGKSTLPSGDNSNSQYAALGLRACMEANVFPPPETLRQVRRWWIEEQNRDGGWCYGSQGSGESYGSMTAGAIAGLILAKHFLGEEWKSDPSVNRGMRWLAANFTVKENARVKGGNAWFYYYYLYGLERVGVSSGAGRFGAHDWYAAGATELLQAQRGDGSWYEGGTYGGAVKDTCFAILFLRRATIPLPNVASSSKR